ncbi:hypothetical protein AAFF_G00163680 [Aldrovandia affinis]|uniref:Uncharacterized protein n=1 Tax=Aldrovandia affinis TaxID=143900 RepID=A0AAD7SZC6_9TELE|nr:hypothetical protein AAFF_G00163680 [Aldrovandia affinis]
MSPGSATLGNDAIAGILVGHRHVSVTVPATVSPDDRTDTSSGAADVPDQQLVFKERIGVRHQNILIYDGAELLPHRTGATRFEEEGNMTQYDDFSDSNRETQSEWEMAIV